MTFNLTQNSPWLPLSKGFITLLHFSRFMIMVQFFKYYFHLYRRNVSYKLYLDQSTTSLRRPDEQPDNPPDQTSDVKPQKNWPGKPCNYEAAFISMDLQSRIKMDMSPQKCILCFEILSNQSLKPTKLQHQFNQKHSAEAEESVGYFKQKKEHLTRRSSTIVQQATIPERALCT